MSTLRDFLANRETEIRQQIKLLRAELSELKQARAAIEQPGNQSDDSVDQVSDSRQHTIKDMVRHVFAKPEAAQGLAAGEVLEAIDREFCKKIERTSLSPQLSRLRESGDVVLQDGRWFPSQPRLTNADTALAAPSVNARRMSFHGGDGESISKHEAFQQAVKAAATALNPSIALEAIRLNNLAASASSAHSLSPAVQRAVEEVQRKIRATDTVLHGQKNWGSGPKTE
jgi:hypothetical protein